MPNRSLISLYEYRLKARVMKNYFIVEFELGDEFVETRDNVSYQMNQLLAEGQIQTYGVAQDNSRMWVTLLADSEFHAWEIVSDLPVNGIMDPYITSLSTYNQTLDLQFPAISLN